MIGCYKLLYLEKWKDYKSVLERVTVMNFCQIIIVLVKLYKDISVENLTFAWVKTSQILMGIMGYKAYFVRLSHK